MNNRPTPETDAIFQQYWHHMPNWLADKVIGELARRLERERNEARQHAEHLQTTINIDRQVDAGHAMYRGGLLSKIDSLEKQLADERALADELARSLERMEVERNSKAYETWKEARK